MSFLKFWGKKDKKEEEDKKDEAPIDPEAEKRKLRHSLSISRSGRFKQRKRERGQILDKPELFAGGDGSSQQDENQPMTTSHHSSSHAIRSTSQAHPRSPHTHQRSPNNTCRDINSTMATGSRPMRMGQSVVT